MRQLRQWLKVTRLVSKPRSIWPQIELAFFTSLWQAVQASERDPGTHRQLPGRCGRPQPASEESVSQRCQICNMPKRRIFNTGRELLRLSNVSLFSPLISIFKSPYTAGTLVPSGAYHPYPSRKRYKRRAISISQAYRNAYKHMFSLVHTNDSARTGKKCIIVQRRGLYSWKTKGSYSQVVLNFAPCE